MDVDRIERDVRHGVTLPAPPYMGQFDPGKEALDKMFDFCRAYEKNTAKIKKDVL